MPDLLSSQLNNQLDHCILETHFEDFGVRYKGKVRDTYRTDDQKLILIASDRISAFDHVLKQAIPFKGQVLNQIAAYFFEQTKQVVPNHIVAVPDPNVTIGELCDIVPVEFVVRGYLAGSAWRAYRAGLRSICGQILPDGLSENQRLPHPILTPTTKATEGHDLDTSKEEIIARGILPQSEFDALENMALALFERGTQMAQERGLILVDTKYEFGRTSTNTFVVADEVHTPDSSRYFYADTYLTLLSEGKRQRQLSKEFVREWLMEHHFQGREGEIMPTLPNDFRVESALRYIELYERITGTSFVPDTNHDPLVRMHKNIAQYLSL